MSKVDMKIFEDLKEALFYESMAKLVYDLCLTDGLDHYPTNLIKPKQDGRKWDDPEYRAEWDKYYEDKAAQENQVLEKFGYEYIDGDSSGEGEGEHCYGVFKLGDNLYRASYYYYSHNGHEYDYIVDTLRIVTPSQKTITVYN